MWFYARRSEFRLQAVHLHKCRGLVNAGPQTKLFTNYGFTFAGAGRVATSANNQREIETLFNIYKCIGNITASLAFSLVPQRALVITQSKRNQSEPDRRAGIESRHDQKRVQSQLCAKAGYRGKRHDLRKDSGFDCSAVAIVPGVCCGMASFPPSTLGSSPIPPGPYVLSVYFGRLAQGHHFRESRMTLFSQAALTSSESRKRQACPPFGVKQPIDVRLRRGEYSADELHVRRLVSLNRHRRCGALPRVWRALQAGLSGQPSIQP